MGFYPPDALVHEAQRRGLTSCRRTSTRARSTARCEASRVAHAAPCVAASASATCAACSGPTRRRSSPRARAGGPFRDLGDLAARAGAGPAGARAARLVGRLRRARRAATAASRCGAWAWRRRAGASRRRHAARAGAGAAGRAARCSALGAWDELLADYDTTGLTARSHPLALLRADAAARGVVASRELPAHRARRARAGRRAWSSRASAPAPRAASSSCCSRTSTGTVNLIVPPELYERSRLTVRTEPLVLAAGRLERHPAARRTGSTCWSSGSTRSGARGRHARRGQELALDGRARRRRAARPTTSAPSRRAVMSFAQGRRR